MDSSIKLIFKAFAFFAVPIIILILFILSLFIFFSSSNTDNVAKVNQNQIKVMRPGITRKEIIDIALTLVGKISYFWGGTSPPGWNPEWGRLKLVKAQGDWSTGTYQPYGLDCSGFVDWCFKTAGTNALYPPTSNQLINTYPIKESELKPGDIVFMNEGITSQNHVGLFYKRENGKNLYIHSEGGTGVTINSTPVFKYWRRPFIRFEDD